MEDHQATQAAVTAPTPELGDDDPNLGRRIGPYRIERRLAAGGMGVVYLAAREDDFEQRVALKLVRRGGDGSGGLPPPVELLRRFYDERQILARLEHPHIARILDGGTTDDALPYFVMEFVEGRPIDAYCEEHDLPLVRRLELFREVCEAVHVAHQSLVVHRDLKPDNILVTSGGLPKLLDFGIAKILQGETAPSAGRRKYRPMTPGYASPEQVLGEPVTTASDVYSLGVLLYRLVSGRHPYPMRELSEKSWVEQVLVSEPPSPSAVAAHPPKRRFARDLDAIVRKAMARQPRQRYASAQQLADDIGRHLEDLPVTAHPDSWLYRVRKLVRRHRLATAFVLFLAGFTVVVTGLWRQAVEERRRAETAQRSAEAVSTFLEDLFKSADPDTARGESLTVREMLDQGRSKLAGELGEAPEIRAELLTALGTVYNNLALYQEAREVKEEALRSRLAIDASDSSDLAADLNNLGRLHYDLGDYDAAETRFQEALAMWRRLGDEAGAVFALRNLAATRMHRGETEGALAIHREVLEIQERLYGPRDPEVATSLYGLGALHRVRGEPAEAEPYLRRALDIYAGSLGARHTRVAAVDNSLGRVLHALGRLAEAREHLERALQVRRQLLGEDHVHVANTRKNLAAVRLSQGDPEVAAELSRLAWETLREKRPEGDWMTADAGALWGSCLAVLGRFEEAEPRVVEGYLALRAVRGEDHADTRTAWQRVVDLYRAWEREIPPSLGG